MGVPQNRWFINVYQEESHLEMDDVMTGVPLRKPPYHIYS